MMTTKPRRTVRVRVRGRVQGVFFRAWTAEEARALGLSGWVRNRRDGSVEAVFSGPPAAVEAMLERCRGGPPLAQVSGLEVGEEATPPPAGFALAPTA